MKKHLFILLTISVLAVSAAGCGRHEEETLAVTDAEAEAMTVEVDTEVEITTAAETDAETEETETMQETESPAAKTTKAVISREEADKLLLEEFGAVDEASGDKNVFIYEKMVTVDGVDYYSYRWEAGDGTYLCNAFVRTDGTDALTGIYADGKWELGSDFGDDDSFDSDDSGDSDDADFDAGYDEEEFDGSDDAPYDDGFEDVGEGEEPAEDDEMADDEEDSGLDE